eukprot:ANDGO_05726.mRNA.1 hypothetical protein
MSSSPRVSEAASLRELLKDALKSRSESETRVFELQQSVQMLEDSLRSVVNQCQSLRSERDRFEVLVDRLAHKLSDAQSRNSVLATDVDSKARENEELVQRLKGLDRSTVAELQDRLSVCLREKEDREKRLLELEAEKTSLLQTIAELQTECAGKEHGLRLHHEKMLEWVKEKVGLVQALDALERQKTGLLETIARKDDEIRRVAAKGDLETQEKIQAIQAEKLHIAQSMESLSVEKEELLAKVRTMSASSDEQTLQIQILEKRVRDAAADVDRQRVLLDELESERGRLCGECEEQKAVFRRESESLQHAKSVLLQSVERLGIEKQELENIKSGLEQQIDNLQRQHSALLQEQERLLQRGADLQRGLDAAAVQRSALQCEKDALFQEYTFACEKLSNKEQENAQLRQSVLESQQSQQSVLVEAQRLQESTAALQSESGPLRELNASLRRDNLSLVETNHSLTDQTERLRLAIVNAERQKKETLRAMDQVQDQLGALQKQNAALQKENILLVQASQVVLEASTNEENQRRWEALSIERSELVRQVAELDKEKQEVTARLTALESQLSDQNIQIRDLAHERDELRAKLGNTEAHFAQKIQEFIAQRDDDIQVWMLQVRSLESKLRDHEDASSTPRAVDRRDSACNTHIVRVASDEFFQEVAVQSSPVRVASREYQAESHANGRAKQKLSYGSSPHVEHKASQSPGTKMVNRETQYLPHKTVDRGVQFKSHKPHWTTESAVQPVSASVSTAAPATHSKAAAVMTSAYTQTDYVLAPGVALSVDQPTQTEISDWSVRALFRGSVDTINGFASPFVHSKRMHASLFGTPMPTTPIQPSARKSRMSTFLTSPDVLFASPRVSLYDSLASADPYNFLNSSIRKHSLALVQSPSSLALKSPMQRALLKASLDVNVDVDPPYLVSSD